MSSLNDTLIDFRSGISFIATFSAVNRFNMTILINVDIIFYFH